MFLGGKAEETPRKLRDVLQVGHHVRSKTTEPLDENGKVRLSISSSGMTVLNFIFRNFLSFAIGFLLMNES